MTMQEAFRDSRERRRAYLEAQMKLQKKQQLKENILFGFVATAIIVMMVMLIGYMNKESLNDCMSAGHSESYCMKGL